MRQANTHLRTQLLHYKRKVYDACYFHMCVSLCITCKMDKL